MLAHLFGLPCASSVENRVECKALGDRLVGPVLVPSARASRLWNDPLMVCISLAGCKGVVKRLRVDVTGN